MDPLKVVTIKRTHKISDGTFGIMDIEGIPMYTTCELPWKDNREDISCIPPGEYACELSFSSKFNMKLYHVLGVPNRTNVMIHVGNTVHDILGCILIGLQFGLLQFQDKGEVYGIISSRPALIQFMTKMAEKPFTLVIKEV